jgi:predicted deacylase
LNEAAPRPRTRITIDIDLAREGKQLGVLSLPFSSDDSAYGRIQVPIVNLKNGGGSRVLLVAGNHGDEYEGQIALMRLARTLAPDAIRGTITILPALNLPAVLADRRNSPLDGGNLNRLFPGDPDGGPTGMIANYVERIILPGYDYVLDLHSGGSSLEYVPCGLIRLSPDAERTRRAFAALEAFGAPIGYISDGRLGGADGTLSAAAERCGVVALTTELGGGATTTRTGLRVAEQGLRRFLRHVGVCDLAVEPPPMPTRVLAVHGPDYYVFSPDDGIAEPLAALGDEVVAGQDAALIHFPRKPWLEPVTVRFRSPGMVICKRARSATRHGDCLYQIATDYRAAA